MGCWAIRTNAIDDPFETNSIYRQRDIIEKGFNQLKNEVGGSRLEATESAYRGKLFIYTLAQSLRVNNTPSEDGGSIVTASHGPT